MQRWYGRWITDRPSISPRRSFLLQCESLATCRDVVGFADACVSGNWKMVEHFVRMYPGITSESLQIRHGAPQLEQCDIVTGLHLAAANGHTLCCRVLLDAGADVDAKDGKGYSPIMYAAHVDVLELLISYGANVFDCSSGATALHQCAFYGWGKRAVVALVSAGADVNAVNCWGETPLLEATASCTACGQDTCTHLEVAMELVKLGANVNMRDVTGKTALHHLSCKHVDGPQVSECIEALSVAGADLNAVDSIGHAPLLIATLSANMFVCTALLEAGADVQSIDHYGHTALFHATTMGYVKLAHQLIEAGADVEACDKDGKSVLSIASALGAENGAGKLCAELIRRGAEVTDMISPNIFLLLREASKTGDVPTLAELVKSGNFINQSTSRGFRLLHIAVEHNQLEAVKWLVDNGAVVCARSSDGTTPLHTAVQRVCHRDQRIAIIKLLLAKGADPTAPSAGNSQTPLGIAKAIGDKTVVALLENAQLANKLIQAGGEATAPDMVAIRFGGPPGAGKSTLTKALKVKRAQSVFRKESQSDEGATNMTKRTKGINCQSYTDHKSARFTIFDLGGQGEFLVSHQMFIGDGLVPIIDCVVVSALDSNLKENAFKWCSLFASRNQPRSSPWPLLLIATRADKCSEQERADVLNVYLKIKGKFRAFFSFPVDTPIFLDARKSWGEMTVVLRKTFTKIHSELVNRHDVPRQPAICQKIAHLLPEMQKEKRMAPVVPKDQFIDFLRPRLGFSDEEQPDFTAASFADLLDKALQFLSGYAIVLSFRQSLAQQYVVVDPQWLLSDVVGRLMAEPPLPGPYVDYVNGYAKTADVTAALHTTHLPGEVALKMVADLGFCLERKVASTTPGNLESSEPHSEVKLEEISEHTDEVLNPSKLRSFQRDKHWRASRAMAVIAGRRLKCRGAVGISSAFFPHLQVHFYHRYLHDYKEKLPLWQGGIRLAAAACSSAEALIEADPANFSIDIIVRGRKASKGDCAELLHDLTEESLLKATEISPGSQVCLFFLSSMELEDISVAGQWSRPSVEYSEERVIHAIESQTLITNGFGSAPEHPLDLLMSHRYLSKLAAFNLEPPAQAISEPLWRIILLNLAKGVNSFDECESLAEKLAVNDRAEDFVKKLRQENPRCLISNVAFNVFCRWLHREGSQQTTEERSMVLHQVLQVDLRRLDLAQLLSDELRKASDIELRKDVDTHGSSDLLSKHLTKHSQ